MDGHQISISMDNKKKILIILIVIFVFTLSYRLMNPYRQETVSRLTFTNSKVYTKRDKTDSVRDAMRSDKVQGVMLDYLLNPPEHFDKVNKNIFFKEEPVKKELILQKDNPIKRVRNEINQFKIFGSYETPDDKAIFFERGKQVLVIREGDKIDGKFIVEKISQQDVSLKSEEIDDRIHIDPGFLKF
jgi:hypothetical protein